MLNLGLLANTVQKNCHISDARHAGDFTLCVFLMKMREYYRWEHQLSFSYNLPQQDVSAWLDEREAMWQGLEASAFEPLPLERGASDPFDTETANRELIPRGYVYSGGYGRFHKPHFFLGTLLHKEERAGHTVVVSSCEYARDLEAPPAMLQGDTIFVRQESVRRFLWEKIEEWRWNRRNEAMSRALACYDFEADAEGALDRMTQNETETMILHELGEALAGERLGADWGAMRAGLARSRTEIAVRAVRDLLADCASTLPTLIERRNTPALHFYFACFTGMRRELFPQALESYRRWVARDDIEPLRAAIAEGEAHWLELAQRLLAAHRTGGADAEAAIERLLAASAGATPVCAVPAMNQKH